MSHPTELRRHYTIYTDGACSPNPGDGGWAAIITWLENGEEKEEVITGAEHNTTNNRMELMAVISSLEHIGDEVCNVTMTTDSQYIANAFTKGWLKKWETNHFMRVDGNKLKPVLNDDLWKRLSKAEAKHHVVWAWVRGHNEHPYNERCDELAVKARLSLR